MLKLNNTINIINDEVDNSIEKNHDSLLKYVGSADGFQVSSSRINNLHHTSNVLFNIMRGGIFVRNYEISKDDFMRFLILRNKNIYNSMLKKIDKLSTNATIGDLIKFGERQQSSSSGPFVL